MDRIPILKLGDALLVTIQVDMHDRLAMALEEDLTARIVATRAKGVLIDISALEIVDSFMGRVLGDIAAMSRILDAETVVVGFNLVDQTKIVTAASEIARNTLQYGGGGTLRLEPIHEGHRRGLRLVF